MIRCVAGPGSVHCSFAGAIDATHCCAVRRRPTSTVILREVPPRQVVRSAAWTTDHTAADRAGAGAAQGDLDQQTDHFRILANSDLHCAVLADQVRDQLLQLPRDVLVDGVGCDASCVSRDSHTAPTSGRPAGAESTIPSILTSHPPLTVKHNMPSRTPRAAASVSNNYWIRPWDHRNHPSCHTSLMTLS